MVTTTAITIAVTSVAIPVVTFAPMENWLAVSSSNANDVIVVLILASWLAVGSSMCVCVHMYGKGHVYCARNWNI